MARRRYLSTDISTDTRVNRLAMDCGDFAALLYTWLIPHAGDDRTLTGDPEELMLKVCPGRRDKSPADIVAALEGMEALGLIEWDRAAVVIHLPLSFYKYQTYIKGDARKTAENSGDTARPTHAEPTPATTPENAGNHQETPDNTASRMYASFSSSVSSSVSVSPSGEPTAPASEESPQTAEPDPKPLPENGPAQGLVKWWCEKTGLEAPADYGKAVGQASKLLKVGVTTQNQANELYEYSLTRFDGGITLGSMLSLVDSWRADKTRPPETIPRRNGQPQITHSAVADAVQRRRQQREARADPYPDAIEAHGVAG